MRTFFVLMDGAMHRMDDHEPPALASWQGWERKKHGIREDLMPHNLPIERRMPSAELLAAMDGLENGQSVRLDRLPRVRRMIPDPRVVNYPRVFRFAQPTGRVVDKRV